MKKLFTILALTAVLALSVAPAVMAGAPAGTLNLIPDACKMRYDVKVTGCPQPGVSCTVGSEATDAPSCGLCCLLNTIYTVTNWIFFIMMTLAVILIVIGGIMFMLSGGDPTKATKGQKMITYAIIGLAIALVARFIPPIIKFIMGVS
ncbi:pilin [Candidatus Parcubacteria bacterium]|nr:pilin [Candidatus Parcubacteria bacterium]